MSDLVGNQNAGFCHEAVNINIRYVIGGRCVTIC